MLSAQACADIEALLTEYGWRIDHHGDVGELFTPDGVVIAPGVGLTLKGRDAIARHFASRAADASEVTRHIWCDLRISGVTGDTACIQTTQVTYLRHASEPAAARHTMVGETHDVVLRNSTGEWRFSERRLEVIIPFDVDPRAFHAPASPVQTATRYDDGVLYYVKARSGDINVARYFARHNLFFAVGDAIGYFPGDLTIGKPVPLTSTFGND
jgi:uncharacterized protein (TIGR02246 family)